MRGAKTPERKEREIEIDVKTKSFFKQKGKNERGKIKLF